MSRTTALQLNVQGRAQFVHVREHDVHRVADHDLREHETFDLVTRLVVTRHPHVRVFLAHVLLAHGRDVHTLGRAVETGLREKRRLCLQTFFKRRTENRTARTGFGSNQMFTFALY